MSGVISISKGDIVMTERKELPIGDRGDFVFVFEVGDITNKPYGGATFEPSAMYVCPLVGSLAKLTTRPYGKRSWATYGALLYFNVEELLKVPPDVLLEYEKLNLV